MRRSRFPIGWDEERVRRIITHYEEQTEEEAVAEDEAALEKQTQAEAKILGRYIIADPAVCHGEPTFRGTRILVADILEQVASGVAWESIVEEWRGTLTTEAIAEAVRLAREALTVYIAN